MRPARILYNGLGMTLLALSWPYVVYAGLRRSKEWKERLGDHAHRLTDSIWVHAASVGEVKAAAPLVERISSITDQPVFFTTVTVTGIVAQEMQPDPLGGGVDLVDEQGEIPGDARRQGVRWTRRENGLAWHAVGSGVNEVVDCRVQVCGWRAGCQQGLAAVVQIDPQVARHRRQPSGRQARALAVVEREAIPVS